MTIKQKDMDHGADEDNNGRERPDFWPARGS
jgi:hypothetical protein